MEIEIIKQVATNGGGVVVCVALVILFLRHIQSLNSEHSARVQAIVDKSAEDHNTTRTAFQQQIQALTERVFEVADKTSAAVGELRTAIVELQTRIKG